MMMFAVSVIGFFIVLIAVFIGVELLCAIDQLKKFKYFIYIYANCIIFFVFSWLIGIVNSPIKALVQMSCAWIALITSIVLLINIFKIKKKMPNSELDNENNSEH